MLTDNRGFGNILQNDGKFSICRDDGASGSIQRRRPAGVCFSDCPFGRGGKAAAVRLLDVARRSPVVIAGRRLVSAAVGMPSCSVGAQ